MTPRTTEEVFAPPNNRGPPSAAAAGAELGFTAGQRATLDAILDERGRLLLVTGTAARGSLHQGRRSLRIPKPGSRPTSGDSHLTWLAMRGPGQGPRRPESAVAVLFELAVADDLQHAPRGARARVA